jgi:ABC-type Mn2+/Zn2+ transport system ATPase subunit
VAMFTFRVSNYRCFGEGAPLTFKIGPGISAFVGPNDAGKSTVLRFFSEFRELWSLIGTAQAVVARAGQRQSVNSPKHVTDPMDVFNDRNALPIQIDITLDDAATDAVASLEIEIERNLQTAIHVRGTRTHSSPTSMQLTNVPSKISLNGVLHDYSMYESIFSVFAAPLYIPAFRNVINSGSTTYYDLAFGTAFIENWNEWKNGTSKVRRDVMLVVEDNIRKLLGYNTLTINASPDKRELRVVVDGRSRHLSEMGSGVSEFLLIIGNLFLTQPKMILIDEPETHLHPLKQIELLRLLLETSGATCLLFATHSLGLARSVTENIMHVQKNGTSGSIVRAILAQPSLQEFLGEMSYTAQCEMGAQTVLFVEGVTDVIPIRHFLRLYNKDERFVLLPLLGNCLINGKRDQELQELSRLKVPCVALLDSERASASEPLTANRRAFLELWKRLGFAAHVLERRALENYFTDAAVKAVMPANSALGHYDKANKNDKARNGSIAMHISRQDLDPTDLGVFLKSL